MKKYNKYTEEQNDIKIGDTVLMGRFKNKKAIVKGFDTDDKGQPILVTTKGKIKLYSVRIEKLMSEKTKKYVFNESKLYDLNKILEDKHDFQIYESKMYHGGGKAVQQALDLFIKKIKNIKEEFTVQELLKYGREIPEHNQFQDIVLDFVYYVVGQRIS